MPCKQPGPHVRPAPSSRAPTAGQLGHLGVVAAVHLPGHARTGPAAGSRTAAGRRRRARPAPRRRAACAAARRRGVASTPSADVGGGAHLQGDAGAGQPVQQRRVLGRAHAVADPVRAQRVEADRDVLRPGQLAAVRGRAAARRARRSGTPARTPRCGPGARRCDSPKPITPRPGVLGGQPGQGPGIQRVPGAVGGDDHADARRRSPRSPRGRRRAPARRSAVSPPRCGAYDGRVDLDLQPAGALGCVVLGRLPQQPPDVGLAADAPSGRCRTAAGTGTSRARRSRAAPAGAPRRPRRAARAGAPPWLAASSTQRGSAAATR